MSCGEVLDLPQWWRSQGSVWVEEKERGWLGRVTRKAAIYRKGVVEPWHRVRWTAFSAILERLCHTWCQRACYLCQLWLLAPCEMPRECWKQNGFSSEGSAQLLWATSCSDCAWLKQDISSDACCLKKHPDIWYVSFILFKNLVIESVQIGSSWSGSFGYFLDGFQLIFIPVSGQGRFKE